MNLNELYRAIPEGRELSLSRNFDGILFRIVDKSRNKIIQASRMIGGIDLLRAGADVEKIFFSRLRDMNAAIDKEISNG
jgi:hypothetical protein